MKNALKRSIAVLMALLMLACAVPFSAFAEEIVITGITVPELFVTEGLYDRMEYDEFGNEFPYYTAVCAGAEISLGTGETLVADEEGWVDIGGTLKHVFIVSQQTYENQLQVGENTVYVQVDGYDEYAFPVTLTMKENPVASATITFKTDLIENHSGFTSYDYNPDTGEWDLPWFCYDGHQNYGSYSLRVEMKDGTVYDTAEGWHDNVPYEGEDYWITWLDDGQRAASQWGLGDHTVPFTILGYKGTATVTVVESPVADIEIDPVRLIAGYDCYQRTTQVGDEWVPYDYYDVDPPRYVITMKDGTVYDSTDEGFEGVPFGESRYYLSMDHDQSYENQWGVGDHTVTASLLGYAEDYTISVVESPVASVEVTSPTMAEHSNGYWDEKYNEETSTWEKTYFRYYVVPSRYVVTMKDGTVYDSAAEGFDGVWYNGSAYTLDCDSDQSEGNRWGVGEHTATFNLLGYTGTYPVTVIESPVASVTVEMSDRIFEWNGGWCTQYPADGGEVTWFSYDVEPDRYVVTMQDGTVFDSATEGFEGVWYDGDVYTLSCESDQSYENQWGVGDHTASFDILGYSFTHTVSVVETPVASVVVDPIVAVENHASYAGNWVAEYNPETEAYDREYFRYYVTPNRYVVTMKDGTVYDSADEGFDGVWYNGTCHAPNYDSYAGQSYENTWGLGDHSNDLWLLGYETTYTVTVIESPVASVEVDPITLTKDVDGYLNSDYNDDTGEWEEYFHYYTSPNRYLVTMQDGTVFDSADEGFDGIPFGNDTFTPEFFSDQSPANRWDEGEYTATVTLLGYTGTYTVTVADTPVESITVDAVELLYNYDGRWSYDYNEATDNYDLEYFRYETPTPHYVVVMKDGTVYDSAAEDFYGVYYNGEYHHLNVSSDQTYANQWTLGDNVATFDLLGYTGTYTATVKESPVANIQAEDFSVTQNYDGRWESAYNPETDEWDLEYFHYEIPSLRYVITMKDGTVYRSDDEDFEGVFYNDRWYGVDFWTNQSYSKQWTGGNVYPVTVSLLGYETTINATVKAPPVTNVVVHETPSIPQGFNGSIVNEGDGRRYFKYTHLTPDCTVYFEDGTSSRIQDGCVFYKDEWHYVEVRAPQSYETQWGLGTHTATLSVIGYTTNYKVQITESQIASVTVDPVTVYQGMDETYEWTWDEELGADALYSCFEYTPSFTVTLTDGTVLKSQNGWVYVDENGYHFDCLDDQSAQNVWGPGEHTATGYVFDREVSFTVTVKENPVASFTVDDVVITPSNADENGYYTYFNDLHYTLTLKDGTVYSGGYWNWVDFNGNGYELSFCDTQDKEPWDLGVHTAVATLLGVETEFTVEITERVTEGDYTYLASQNGAVIVDCSAPQTKHTVPATLGGLPVVGVVSLGESGVGEIQTLTLPDSVVTLGRGLFENMSRLQTLNVGAGVSVLTADMLQYCSTLHQINVSDANPHFVSIAGAVYDAAVETLLIYPLAGEIEYTVPASVTDIALLGNPVYSFVKLTVPADSVGFVAENGVIYDKDKTMIVAVTSDVAPDYTLPATITYIMPGAFDGDTIVNLTVGAGVTDIMYSTFANCTSLQSVTLPQSLESIGAYAFADCTALQSVTMPSVEAISDYAFYGCKKLDGLTLPEGLTTLGDEPFAYTGLSAIVLPDSLEEVGYGAFYQAALEQVTLGGGLTAIGMSMFEGTKLTSVTFPANIRAIDARAFLGTKLASITLPETVSFVGYAAFGNTLLTSVLIPDHVTFAGSTFSGCKKLTAVSFESGVTYLPEAMFRSSGLKKITLPAHIAFVGESAFEGCTSLTSAVFQNEAIEIGACAFADSGLKEVNLGDKVTHIDTFTFSGTKITKLTVPKGVTNIMYGAFFNCESLASISLPEKVEQVGGLTFHNTAWYTAQKNGPVYLNHVLYRYKGDVPKNTVFVPKKGTTVIADYAFDNDLDTWNDAHDTTGLTEVVLRYGTKTVGLHAFANCTGLIYITIPETVTYIDDYAFRGSYGEDVPVIIRGKAGSYAEDYAEEYGYRFEEACTHKKTETVKAKDATYFATGLTAGEKCSSCGFVMVKQEKTAKKTLGKTSLKLSDATSSTVKLTWSKISGASGYRVYNKTTGKYYETTSTSYTFKSLSSNKAYSFQVRAFVKSGSKREYGSLSSTLSARTLLSTPKVTAKGTTDGSKLSWKKVSGAKGYLVYYRSYKSGKWSSWKRLTKTTKTSYTHKGSYGTSYRYYVKAYNSYDASLSDYTSTDTIVRLARPTVKTSKSGSYLKSTWKKSAGAKKYIVYRRTYNSKTKKWGSWKTMTTTTKLYYTDKTIKKGTYYQYAAKAYYNSNNYSTYTAGNKIKR